MPKIVITDDRGVWRVSRRVFAPTLRSTPGLVVARSVIRLVTWPVLWVLNLVGLRPWRVEARTVDGLPVAWYVRGTGRAKRVAREVIAALVDGRDLDEVEPSVRRAEGAPGHRAEGAPGHGAEGAPGHGSEGAPKRGGTKP